MGARLGVAIATLVLSVGVARAQRATLEPSKLSLFVPSGWQVMRDRAGDFLHWETSSDGGRSFDLSVERVTVKCKAWKAESGSKKQSPAYWPKKARSALFMAAGTGVIHATGCLADATGGALLVRLEISVEDPKYKPNKEDAASLKEAIENLLEASENLPPLGASATTSSAQTTTADTAGKPGVPIGPTGGGTPPVSLGDLSNAVKGGTVATVPRLEIPVRLPKAASWIVGARGEATISRADMVIGSLTATLFPLVARTCNEWRVDTSTNAFVTYETKADYLPGVVKTGAFRYMANGMQVSICLPTKVGTVGVSVQWVGGGRDYIEESKAGPSKDEVALIRQLIEGIAVGAAKHASPLMAEPPLVEGGNHADASIGSIWLPKGAQWRITNGTVERVDKGKYFTVSSMSRPTACEASRAKDQPYLPAGIKATVETRSWGTTIVKACFGSARTIELTLAYDGAIAAGDHALIKSLVDAFVSATKKKG
jgi:hypothetical protein